MYGFWKEEKAGKLKHRDNLPAFIFVMARNIWLMQKRKAKRGQFQEYATDPQDFAFLENKAGPPQEEAAFNALIRSEEEEAAWEQQQQRDLSFQRAFQQLSEQCRHLLTQFIVEKVRLKDLQQQLGYSSADAVKMAKYRCKKNLVRFFKQQQGKR